MRDNKNKKSKFKSSEKDQAETKSAQVSAWKTPAGIAAILGAIATLITALVGAYSLLNKTPPAAIPTEPSAETIIDSNKYCDGYFEGWVFDVQAGTPAAIELQDYDVVTIKLMSGNALIGSIRYIPSLATVLIADEKCFELQPATEILPDIENRFDFDELTAVYKYELMNNRMFVAFTKK